MATINLAPGAEYLRQAGVRRRRVYMVAFVIVLVAAVLWGVLFAYGRVLEGRSSELGDRINAINMEIARLDSSAKRIVSFENRLTALDALLDSHVSWEPVFAEIERLLPPPVVTDGMQLSLTRSSVTVAAHTSDLDQVAQTMASLTNAPGHETLFTNTVISSVTRDVQNTEQGEAASAIHRFSFELTFDARKLRSASGL